MQIVCMSNEPLKIGSDRRGFEAVNEIFVFAIVILIFTAAVSWHGRFYESSIESFQDDELYQKASVISNDLIACKELLYLYKPAVFNHIKLSQLSSSDLNSLVFIPDRHWLVITIKEVPASAEAVSYSLSVKLTTASDPCEFESAVVETPVNIYMPDSDIRPAVMTVTLMR